ncbi:MAG: SDR family oxidoreductase [Mycobacteriaceae bacterium]
MARTKILITGASSGLGEGMARRFAAQGRDLALCARRIDKLEALRSELLKANPSSTVLVEELDVNDHAAVAEVFSALDQKIGGLDRVIVNAGLGKGAPIGTGKAYANIETVQTNLVAALAQTEAALELFRDRNNGHLVLISSMSAVRGLPKTLAAYSASKAGLAALGQGLHTEFAKSPIRITTILPGYIRTAMSEQAPKSPLMADTDAGVDSLVKAIEREPARAVVPRWPWVPIDWALRSLPDAITARMV